MAGGKLTPRQRMINMMYLVLTALLALNVSKEIINAFVTVDESLRVSNTNVEDKNKKTYAAFAQAMQQDPKKYGDVDAKAKNIKKASDDLIAYIKGIKDSLVIKADAIKPGQPVPDLRDMKSKDNWDIPTMMMCGSANDGKGFRGTELKNKLEEYKKVVLTNLPKDTATQKKFTGELNGLLDTSDPDPNSTEYKEDKKRTWEMSKFYHNPVVAAAAILTKFQGDIKNAESHSIDYLLSSVNMNAVIMDVYQAKVIPNSTVVTIGSDYKADVFLSATSSTLAPDVFIGAHYDSSSKSCKGCDGKPLPVEEGIAKYSSRPGSEGEQKWGGVIRVKKPDLSYDYYNFESAYTAQKPNGVVSADKMNVLFIGLDNPVSVSVPGVPNNKVRPSITAGSLRPDPKAGAGHYIANVSSGTPNVSINVSAEIDGKQTPMGKFDFRVKSVPNPTATIADKESGNINKNLLLASAIIPKMKDFYFELYWKINSFKMSITGKGTEYQEFEGTGNTLSEPMKASIQRARPGTKVIFEFMKATQVNTKDNSSRLLSPMSFVIQ
jgi:gliding motility-associated protein GldM